MASVPGNTIDPTVSDRHSAPYDSRVQHYNRPGNPMHQVTRTFSNGSTLTFGSADIIGHFTAHDPFYEQVVLVDAATTNMVAIRNQHQDAGNATMSDIGATSSTVGQHGHDDVSSSSLQNSFTGLSISAGSSAMAGHQNATMRSNHNQTKEKPQNFAKGSRKNRHHGQPSNRGHKKATGNVHKAHKKSNRPGTNHAASHNSSGFDGPPQHTSHIAAQGHSLAGDPSIQPGFHYNSFGAGVPGLIPQQASHLVAQGPAPTFQVNQSGNHMNAQYASQVRVQGPAQPSVQMNQSGNHFNAHHASSFEVRNPVQSTFQIPQSGFEFNTQAAASNIAAQNASHLNWRGPTLAVPLMTRLGISFNPEMAAWCATPANHFYHNVQFEGPLLLPNYYELRVNLSLEHQDCIMAANGIRLPATYIPDPRIYHGPLYLTVEAVEKSIVNATEFQYPEHTFFEEWSEVAEATMLSPLALPPYCYMPGTLMTDIHISECNRHWELMKEVLAVPGDPEQGEEPMRWYRIFGEPRLRLEQPAWHPHVVDLYGPKSQYEQLLVRDVNYRNDNETGVGRRCAPVIQETDAGPTIISGSESQSATANAQRGGENPSIFVRDNRTPPPNHTQVHYIGYRMRVKRHEEPNPEISPTPPSRGRSGRAFADKASKNNQGSHSATKTPLKSKRPSGTQEKQGESSASKTPLLDFDSDYTARYGEGDDVDFAVRDMGAPRINGMTFNEAIGYTPSPGNPLRSPESVFYPMNVPRRIRD